MHSSAPSGTISWYAKDTELYEGYLKREVMRDDCDWELDAVKNWGVPRAAAQYWNLDDFYDPRDDHTHLAANVEGRVASWSDLSGVTGIMGGFAMGKAGTDPALGDDSANDCYAILIAIAISLLTSATVILSVMIWTVRRELAQDESLATSGSFDVFDPPVTPGEEETPGEKEEERKRELKFLRGMGANMLLQTYLGEDGDKWDKRDHFRAWPGCNANWFQFPSQNLLWWSKFMFNIGMAAFLAAATMEHQGSVDPDGSWPQVLVIIIMCLPMAGAIAVADQGSLFLLPAIYRMAVPLPAVKEATRQLKLKEKEKKEAKKALKNDTTDLAKTIKEQIKDLTTKIVKDNLPEAIEDRIQERRDTKDNREKALRNRVQKANDQEKRDEVWKRVEDEISHQAFVLRLAQRVTAPAADPGADPVISKVVKNSDI